MSYSSMSGKGMANSNTEMDDLDYLLPANCPNTYFDTWDRHNSIAFSTAAKGLRNAPGENNCFVNSAVQVFWHLDVFRRSCRRLSGHTCMGNSCIFCALKVIFTQFQFSDQSSLHPDALRKALAETFANQQRFQLGHMDDAAECFENILRRIHFHIANTCNEDSCTAPHCLPHQKFSLNILEKVVCPCGASSSPLKFNEMVHYISAKALVSQARVMQETGDVLHPDRFGLLLRNANAMGDMRDCPGACGKTVQIRRTLMNSPDVVSIGLVWDSDHPTVETTTEVAKSIGTTILMQDVFHSVMQDLRSLPKLQLVGLVCYYGKHYSTFVFHSKLQVWIYFDDATVREIGPRWENVVDKCSKGRYQPLLLLYANPNANPVPVDTAPKKRTMAPGYGIPGGPEEESSLDRSRESITSQQNYSRSRTPNPEPSSHQMLDQGYYPRARSVTPSSATASDGTPIPHLMKAADHSRQQSFIMAMGGKNPDNKAKHPLRFGGQAGPMTPISSEAEDRNSSFSSQSSQAAGDQSYSDYTLSTSDQYRRPSMSGFEPQPLPLTPNAKSVDAQRKESFKKGKETVRADVVRYPVDASRAQGVISPTNYNQSQAYRGQGNGPGPTGGHSTSYFQGAQASSSHIRQRSLSQGGDEAYASDASVHDSQPSQHTIVKPVTMGTHNYDHLDGMSQSHTPVQSGLATLPRNKKKQEGSNQFHQRQGSGLSQDGRQGSIGNLNSIQDPRSMSNPAGLPPPVPSKNYLITEGADGKKLPETDKKAKKLKKELKKAEKKKSKQDPTKIQNDAPPTSISQPSTPTPGSESGKPSDFRNEKIYIDRRMVETILKHQGLQRQPSTHSTNSSSSIESDSMMGRLLAAKHSEGGLPTDTSFDNVSIGSHKDSGYGSSDRNSSSSTGSGTIDPYTQYFISKSMVVPRNLNPQMLQQLPQQMVSDFTAPNPQVYNVASQGGQPKDLSSLSKEDMSRHLYETLTQRKIMHPIKESSQEDILKLLPKDASNATSARGPSPSPASLPEIPVKEARPPPIPPKNFAAFQVSKSAHQREPSLDSLDKNEVKNEYFLSMCEKADDLMDRCILAETQEDLSAALRFCDGALGCLKEAMNQTDIANKALVYAQKKHNSCLLKSRSLFKRSSGYGSSDGSSQGGKRSSITSTDSDNSDKPVRRMPSKERLGPPGRQPARPGAPGVPPSGQTRHQMQGSNSSVARNSPVPTPQTPANVSSTKPNQFSVPSLPSTTQNYPSSGKTSNLNELQQNVPSRSHLSRSSAADTESNHSRSGSNSSIRSSSSVPNAMSSASSQNLPKSHSSVGSMSAAAASANNAPMPLDAYGTLPRNRKPRRTSDPTGNSEVYQAYLNRQKTLQGSSGSDNRESDSSSEGNTQKQLNKAEIRELLQNNMVQRQMQQLEGKIGATDLREESKFQGLDSRSLPGQRHSHDNVTNRSQFSVVDADSKANQYNQGSYLNPSAPVSHSQQQPFLQNSQNFSSGANASPFTGSGNAQYSNGQSSQQQSRTNQSSSQLQQAFSQPSRNPNVNINHPPQNVSGYSQPLPGQRPSSQSARTENNFPASRSYTQGFTTQSQSRQGSQTPTNDINSRNNIPFVDSNSSHLGSTNASLSQTQSTNNLNRLSRDSHNSTGVQNATENIQNLSLNRRHSGGPPPAPPARTTSNPDFRQQLQSQQGMFYNPPEAAVSHDDGSQTQSRPSNIARIQPNSHLGTGAFPHPDRVPFLVGQARQSSSTPTPTGSAPVQLPGMKHASSSTGLNYLPMAPRPLERCSSQPDCQNLIDPRADIVPHPFPSGQHASNNNPSPGFSNSTLGSGPGWNLPQTSNIYHSDDENNEDRAPKPSVRALASRFDSSSNSQHSTATKPSLKSSRARSKSESGSKKPKSVLKSKKNKSGGKAPRKSVTFADMAAGYESAAELTSFSSSAPVNDRAYFSDDEDNFVSRSVGVSRVAASAVSYSDNDLDDVDDRESSNSDETPLSNDELACQLCRKREVEHGKAYCSKCSFYMGRLAS